MTILAPQQNGATAPFGEGAIPPQLDFPLLADAQGGKLQFITIDPSTGLASPADDNTPGQIAAGVQFPDELSATSPEDGAATVRVMERAAVCLAPSTIANDGFAATDVGVPFWIADTNTPGKLSHTSTKNRSLGGLVLGLVAYGSTGIRFIGGVVGQLLGRAAMMANAFPGGSLAKAIDAGAATDLAETFLDGIARVHGPVAAVYFDVSGTTLAASGGTDYKTLILCKRTAALPGTQVTVATVDTKTTAFTQYTSIPFTLSAVAGAIDLLEDDLLTVYETHGGSGAIIPAGKIRVIRKAI